MFISIRDKLLALVVIAMAAAVGLNALLIASSYKLHTLESAQDSALALGRGLQLRLQGALRAEQPISELPGLDEQCDLARHGDQRFALVMLQDMGGKVLCESVADGIDSTSLGITEPHHATEPYNLTTVTPENAERVLQTLLPLRDAFDEQVGVIRVAIAESSIDGSLRRLYARSAAFAGLMIAAAAGLLMLLVGRVLTAPLQRLTNAMRQFASDGLAATPQLPVKGRGEVAELTSAFNQMIQRLDEAEQRARRDASALATLAHYDALTELPNRASFLEQGARRISRARESGETLALLFIDLDRFKLINDSYGHGVGDEVLKFVSQRLQRSARAHDLTARLSGDEFVILLREVTKVDFVGAVCRRILEAVDEPIVFRGHNLSLTVSIGISLFPQDGDDLESLLSFADVAMYQAKQSGRNAYRFFSKEMNTRYEEYVHLENRLRRALGNDEIEVHLQPKFNTADGKLAGFEALARWEPAGVGRVSPARFIEVAEDSGLIIHLGHQIVRKSCHAAKRLQDAGYRLPLAFNVSMLELLQRDFVERVTRIIEESGVEPALLEIELTENVFVRRDAEELEALDLLSKSGIGISIDDFGKGYSSLSRLQSYPVNRLKIDRSFTSHLDDDNRTQAVVASIINLGHNLGLKVLAEGVERVDQLKTLRDLGCDEVQGFLFHPAMPLTTIEQMLAGDHHQLDHGALIARLERKTSGMVTS